MWKFEPHLSFAQSGPLFLPENQQTVVPYGFLLLLLVACPLLKNGNQEGVVARQVVSVKVVEILQAATFGLDLNQLDSMGDIKS